MRIDSEDEPDECASEQGKFWEMHDKMFENQQLLGLEQFKKWARELKLNGAKFDSCLDTGKFAAKVAGAL
jgi:protein-disulfide isomerase